MSDGCRGKALQVMIVGRCDGWESGFDGRFFFACYLFLLLAFMCRLKQLIGTIAGGRVGSFAGSGWLVNLRYSIMPASMYRHKSGLK